ncbi:ribonuclease H-like domain-containing protein [Tanacetum coccineum]|uniref:Ribonuclease H-like domain-containing protein n=1 Tax=Tanacetum coccineum TaxID=301880 RepID=A0ABQ5FUX3_9ASTR
MNNEIEALNRYNTWTVCDLLVGRKAVGSKWLWKIKYKYTGEIERNKARVVAKGFSQRKGFDYLETFSHVVKMSIVRCVLNVAICNGWDLFQLDINNAFLYGDLSENVYMTLPPGFDNDKSKVCNFVQSKFDYYLFTKSSDNVFIILLMYVDDIVLLSMLILLFPENATLNHTESDDDHLLVNVSNYQRLVDAALRVLRYLKGSPGSGIQINKIGNLKLRAYDDSDWARSSAETEYRSMASATCEVIWLSNLLGDMSVKNLLPFVMYYDNSSALQIAANSVFHEKSKHFEIDVYLVREKVASGAIKTKKIHTTQQIANILTKEGSDKDYELNLSMYRKAAKLEKQMNAKLAWIHEKYNHRSETHIGGSSSQTHEIGDVYLTAEELHQLHLDEEALRETLEEQTMDEKAREEKIRQKQADDDEYFMEFGVMRIDSDYESSD